VPKDAAYAMRFTFQSFANSRYAFSIAEKKYFGRQTWSLPTMNASKFSFVIFEKSFVKILLTKPSFSYTITNRYLNKIPLKGIQQ
jgi:hypothetical protein